MLEAPYPELDDLLEMMGEAGQTSCRDSKPAKGRREIFLSVCVGMLNPRTRFPVIAEIELPQPVPELAGATFLVSGSGRR